MRTARYGRGVTLDETIAIRTRSGATIPLIERGAALPAERRETLSTSTDGQPSIRCELIAGSRSSAVVEIGVPHAPRGVAQALLVVRVDANGSVQVLLDGEHGNASASFSARIVR